VDINGKLLKMLVSEDEFFYELHNGDRPPYCDIFNYLLSVGSIIYYEGREYEVIEYDITNHPYPDNTWSLICVRCKWNGNDVDFNGIVRDIKLDKILL